MIPLPVFDLVNELDAGDRDCCMVEALKAEQWPHSLFDARVVLFDHVV
jgi:hypothetical protein